MSAELFAALSKFVTETVEKQVKQELSKFNVQETVQYQTKAIVQQLLTKLEMPEKSIDSSAIDWAGFSFDSTMVKGTFANIQSSGISDNAQDKQLTINDQGIVATSISAETISTNSAQFNQLTVTDMSEFTNATFSGDVNIAGKLTTDSLAGLQEQLTNTQSYTINGKTVLSEAELGPSILYSNLRKVGYLTELQVQGEALIGDVLYVSPSGRVGINTDEPTHGLTVWDSEVCLTIGKHEKDTAIIGTERNQNILIKSGTNENIVLHANGKTAIDKPVLNGKAHTSESMVPGYAGQLGDICWNSTPEKGKAVGWVCIGGTQWCSFGNIV